MIQEFKVKDKKSSCDLYLVPQNAYIDLRVAYRNGSVPADFSDADLQCNGISDPRSIVGKPDDIFSAMRAAAAVNKPTSSVTTASSPSNNE